MTVPDDDDVTLGRGLQPGAPHYRAFVGPPAEYDIGAAMQFNLLTALGLREKHALLDIGCGSLRAGRLFIVYLRPGQYFGLEPEAWLVEEGIKQELGREILTVKRPTFSHDRDFTLSTFGRQFDFLLAQSVFSHSAPQQIRRVFAEARSVMSPTGVFVATFFSGPESYTGQEWVYPGIVRYAPGDIEAFAREQGLACQRVDWTHPTGQTWIAITHAAHRNEVRLVTNRCRMVLVEHWLRHPRATTLGLARRVYRRLRS
jgi:SAM-dependent methyltransferase